MKSRKLTGPPKSVAYDAAGNPTQGGGKLRAKTRPSDCQAFHCDDSQGGISLRETSDSRKAGEGNSGGVSAARGRGNFLAEEHVLDRRHGAAFHPPDSLGGGAARGKAAASDVGRRRSREILGRASVSGQVEDPGAAGAKDYVQKLRTNFVLVRPEERRKKIEAELARLAGGKGLRIHEDAHLLDLVTYLNEYPAAILGGFDPAYLELPEEILITVMRGHQKYFALETKGRVSRAAFSGGHQSGQGSRRADSRRARARVARAIRRCALLLGDRSKMSARRLSSETERRDLPGEARKLWRQSRARAHPGSLARRAMVCQRNPAGKRGRGRPRRRTCQVRSGHGHGSRVYRAAGNRGRPVCKSSRRT